MLFRKDTCSLQNMKTFLSIGKIGTKLGEHDINIGIMQVGREEKGGIAIMILTLDKEIPKDVIKEIQELENVYEAIGVEL